MQLVLPTAAVLAACMFRQALAQGNGHEGPRRGGGDFEGARGTGGFGPGRITPQKRFDRDGPQGGGFGPGGFGPGFGQRGGFGPGGFGGPQGGFGGPGGGFGGPPGGFGYGGGIGVPGLVYGGGEPGPVYPPSVDPGQAQFLPPSPGIVVGGGQAPLSPLDQGQQSQPVFDGSVYGPLLQEPVPRMPSKSWLSQLGPQWQSTSPQGYISKALSVQSQACAASPKIGPLTSQDSWSQECGGVPMDASVSPPQIVSGIVRMKWHNGTQALNPASCQVELVCPGTAIPRQTLWQGSCGTSPDEQADVPMPMSLSTSQGQCFLKWSMAGSQTWVNCVDVEVEPCESCTTSSALLIGTAPTPPQCTLPAVIYTDTLPMPIDTTSYYSFSSSYSAQMPPADTNTDVYNTGDTFTSGIPVPTTTIDTGAAIPPLSSTSIIDTNTDVVSPAFSVPSDLGTDTTDTGASSTDSGVAVVTSTAYAPSPSDTSIVTATQSTDISSSTTDTFATTFFSSSSTLATDTLSSFTSSALLTGVSPMAGGSTVTVTVTNVLPPVTITFTAKDQPVTVTSFVPNYLTETMTEKGLIPVPCPLVNTLACPPPVTIYTCPAQPTPLTSSLAPIDTGSIDTGALPTMVQTSLLPATDSSSLTAPICTQQQPIAPAPPATQESLPIDSSAPNVPVAPLPVIATDTADAPLIAPLPTTDTAVASLPAQVPIDTDTTVAVAPLTAPLVNTDTLPPYQTETCTLTNIASLPVDLQPPPMETCSSLLQSVPSTSYSTSYYSSSAYNNNSSSSYASSSSEASGIDTALAKDIVPLPPMSAPCTACETLTTTLCMTM